MLRRIGLNEGQIKEMFVAHSQDVVIGTGAVNYDWTEPQKIYRIPIKGYIKEFNFDEILRVYSYNVDSSSDYGLSPLVPAAILAEKFLTLRLRRFLHSRMVVLKRCFKQTEH
jgi:hypothetical protein